MHPLLAMLLCPDWARSASRLVRVAVCTGALAGCQLYGCELPGSTISEYIGKLGQSSAGASATEADSGVVTIILNESDAGGSLDGVAITVAKPGLRGFGDQLHVHDRRNGNTVLSSSYGDYRSDSLVFRSTEDRQSGRRLWDNLKAAVDAGRAYFEVHSATGADTAGIRLLSRRYQAGRCT